MANLVHTTKQELSEIHAELEGKKAPEAHPEGAAWNTIEEAFLKRRSVRKYKKKQVPEHYIRRILEVARYAPSQGNCQPWKFVVVRDKAMIDEMESFVLELMKMMSSAPPTEGAPETHPVPRRLISEAPPDKGIGVFHGAPTVIFPAMDTRGIGHPEVDLGIVGTNIVMAAYSLGLGTCWVGFAELLNAGDWSKRLDIEEPYRLIEAIAIGYPMGDPQRNFVHRETHKTTWFEDGKKRVLY